MKHKCLCCPFNDGLNEEATQAQNYGCLPTSDDMIRMFDETGVALSCHENNTVGCNGLRQYTGVSKFSTVKSYEEWYRGIV